MFSQAGVFLGGRFSERAVVVLDAAAGELRERGHDLLAVVGLALIPGHGDPIALDGHAVPHVADRAGDPADISIQAGECDRFGVADEAVAERGEGTLLKPTVISP
jgi:hypothetical protein